MLLLLLLLLLLPVQGLLPSCWDDYAVHGGLERQRAADIPEGGANGPGVDVWRQAAGGAQHGARDSVSHAVVAHHQLNPDLLC